MSERASEEPPPELSFSEGEAVYIVDGNKINVWKATKVQLNGYIECSIDSISYHMSV